MESIAIKTISGQPVLAPSTWLSAMVFRIVHSMLHRNQEKQVLTKEASASMEDQKAAQLLDLYGNSILRLAYSYLHNMSDAEDILQDTMMQYLKNSPSFENASYEKAWLMRVAANLSKNKIKYQAIRMTDELSDNLHAAEKQDLSFVWDAVKQLPVKYRETIHLYYYEGYSTSEVSQILGRKESTVRSDLRRGRQALKEILREEYDFE